MSWGISDKEKDEMLPTVIHEVIMSGYDGVVNLKKDLQYF